MKEIKNLQCGDCGYVFAIEYEDSEGYPEYIKCPEEDCDEDIPVDEASFG